MELLYHIIMDWQREALIRLRLLSGLCMDGTALNCWKQKCCFMKNFTVNSTRFGKNRLRTYAESGHTNVCLIGINFLGTSFEYVNSIPNNTLEWNALYQLINLEENALSQISDENISFYVYSVSHGFEKYGNGWLFIAYDIQIPKLSSNILNVSA